RAWWRAPRRHPSASPSLEHGWPLLAERRQRLTVVLAVEGQELERRRGVEGDVERLLDQQVLAPHSIAVSASRPSGLRPASSRVAGATIMCCVATWMSRKQRWRGLAAESAVPPPAPDTS